MAKDRTNRPDSGSFPVRRPNPTTRLAFRLNVFSSVQILIEEKRAGEGGGVLIFFYFKAARGSKEMNEVGENEEDPS